MVATSFVVLPGNEVLGATLARAVTGTGMTGVLCQLSSSLSNVTVAALAGMEQPMNAGPGCGRWLTYEGPFHSIIWNREP